MLRLPLNEYFLYHPPNAERAKKHDAANALTLDLCQDLIQNYSVNSLSMSSDQAKLIKTKILGNIKELCLDSICQLWAESSLNEMLDRMTLLNQKLDLMSIFMYCKQVQMFVNLSITIDELHKNIDAKVE